MFKLLFSLGRRPGRRGSAEGQRGDVEAEVALTASREVKRIHNNEKCIYPQLLVLLLHPPPPPPPPPPLLLVLKKKKMKITVVKIHAC